VTGRNTRRTRVCTAGTQYEAWLSLQTLSAHGLSPAAEADRRCQIVPIQNANSTVVEALLTMWANKTPQEAHTVLSKSDIAVRGARTVAAKDAVRSVRAR
jgi:hypothetical protein